LLLTLPLSAKTGALTGTVVAAVPMTAARLIAAPSFIATPKVAKTPLLLTPRGIVVLLSALAAITFLAEWTILDWGALLLVGKGLVDPRQAGLGYSVFVATMTARPL